MSAASPSRSPAWARGWLRAAGVYNLAWGALVIAFPRLLFDLAGMEPPNYPQIWQCVGMIVGVYGLGYLIAARDPRTHWPIVLVGLLGKVFGPLGMAYSLWNGDLPWLFALTILTNDLVWWIPFALILWDAAKGRGEPAHARAPTLAEALGRIRDQHGRSLGAVTDHAPTLVLLTRHSGCTFCREALQDLAARLPEIRSRGLGAAVVTMSPPAENLDLARRYGLESLSWFSDPDRIAYAALELRRGSFLDLFGPSVVFRGLAATLRGHRVGKLVGDAFQMPGAFILYRGAVLRAFRHPTAAARPDFQDLCELPA